MSKNVSDINLAAMTWADKQGWNQPKKGTILRDSRIITDVNDPILSLLSSPVGENDYCSVILLERVVEGGRVAELAFLLVCWRNAGCEVIKIADPSESARIFVPRYGPVDSLTGATIAKVHPFLVAVEEHYHIVLPTDKNPMVASFAELNTNPSELTLVGCDQYGNTRSLFNEDMVVEWRVLMDEFSRSYHMHLVPRNVIQFLKDRAIYL